MSSQNRTENKIKLFYCITSTVTQLLFAATSFHDLLPIHWFALQLIFATKLYRNPCCYNNHRKRTGSRREIFATTKLGHEKNWFKVFVRFTERTVTPALENN